VRVRVGVTQVTRSPGLGRPPERNENVYKMFQESFGTPNMNQHYVYPSPLSVKHPSAVHRLHAQAGCQRTEARLAGVDYSEEHGVVCCSAAVPVSSGPGWTW
jgi:hypothetical protein